MFFRMRGFHHSQFPQFFCQCGLWWRIRILTILWSEQSDKSSSKTENYTTILPEIGLPNTPWILLSTLLLNFYLLQKTDLFHQNRSQKFHLFFLYLECRKKNRNKQKRQFRHQLQTRRQLRSCQNKIYLQIKRLLKVQKQKTFQTLRFR